MHAAGPFVVACIGEVLWDDDGREIDVVPFGDGNGSRGDGFLALVDARVLCFPERTKTRRAIEHLGEHAEKMAVEGARLSSIRLTSQLAHDRRRLIRLVSGDRDRDA